MTGFRCPECPAAFRTRRGLGNHGRSHRGPYGGLPPIPLEDRFWPMVDRSGGPAACWPWTGFVHPQTGYGKVMVRVDGKRVPRQAHRIAFELARGPIPDGLEMDHLCRERACVNPAHLEPVTHAENNRRAWAAREATHCQEGHPYDDENTYRTPAGHRQCRACDRRRGREYRARRAARSAA